MKQENDKKKSKKRHPSGTLPKDQKVKEPRVQALNQAVSIISISRNPFQ